jgi:hypothetical protein
MTLAIAFKAPEGIVLAADSRVTLTPAGLPGIPPPQVYFDNATKLLSVNGQASIGIVTHGTGAIGQQDPRTAHGFMPEFEEHLSENCSERATVEEVATELGTFFSQQWTQAGMPDNIDPMNFIVTGFDKGSAYGRLFDVSVPNAAQPVEQLEGDRFGIHLGGQADLVQRLMGGFDGRTVEIAKQTLGLDDQQAQNLHQALQAGLGIATPYQFLPLQDCVDMSMFLVKMTAAIQGWTIGVRGVGGAVDVATITRTDGFKPIQQKTIQARSAFQ